MDIVQIDGDEGIDEALSIRRAVFIREQEVPQHRELDGLDSDATHFVAYENEEPVGTARLRRYEADTPDKTAKVERVAVLEDHRGKGLGRDLMVAVDAEATERGYDSIVLHAQASVVSFYRVLGYRTVGEEFEDAGILHRKMTKSLP